MRWLVAMALAGCAGAQKGPCSDAALAEIVAECRARVRAECAHDAHGIVDEGCITLKECDARIEQWEVCGG
ncbi:MAG TPA: hypothetical protein VKY73_00525 [Polyangiaceae bacterium]|nr:hypothetical protein [Polyangiaceae bacterium]